MALPKVVHYSIPAQINKANCEKMTLNCGNRVPNHQEVQAIQVSRKSKDYLTAWEIIVLGEIGPVAWAHLVFSSVCCLSVCSALFKETISPLSFTATSHFRYKPNSICWGCKSKASTICLIYDLWSFYERVLLSLHQRKWANLMTILPSPLFISNWTQGSATKLS